MKITKVLNDRSTHLEKLMNESLEKKDYKKAKYHLWRYDINHNFIKKRGIE